MIINHEHVLTLRPAVAVGKPESTRRVVNLGARVDSQRVMDGLWDIHEFLGDQQIEQRKDEMLSGAAFVKGRTC